MRRVPRVQAPMSTCHVIEYGGDLIVLVVNPGVAHFPASPQTMHPARPSLGKSDDALLASMSIVFCHVPPSMNPTVRGVLSFSNEHGDVGGNCACRIEVSASCGAESARIWPLRPGFHDVPKP